MEKLRDYIATKQMNQTQFAELLGVSQATVNRYISGTRFPKPKVMLKIKSLTAGYISPNDWYENQANRN